MSRARLPLGPVAVGVVLALGAAGTAAAADFEPRRGAWNGLSYFVATAAEAKVELEVHDALDWTTVSPRTIVLLVAPRVGPRRDDPSLSAFMAAGGRLIVADDFRAGYAWLRGFGLRLQNRAGPAGAYVGDLRFLPRFSLRALGPYLAFHDHHADAEPVVVLNHPASLSVREPPPEGMKPRIRGWFGDRARGWLAEVTGAAKVLAVADSSAFINAMMRGFYGNKQLAANVLRYYCYAGEPCRVRLIANLAEISGRFDASAHADEGPPGHADARRSLRRMADRLAELMGRRELALLWSLLVLAAMAVPVLMTSRTPAPMLPPRTVVGRTRSRLQDTVAAWLATPDAPNPPPTAGRPASSPGCWPRRSGPRARPADYLSSAGRPRRRRPWTSCRRWFAGWSRASACPSRQRAASRTWWCSCATSRARSPRRSTGSASPRWRPRSIGRSRC